MKVSYRYHSCGSDSSFQETVWLWFWVKVQVLQHGSYTWRTLVPVLHTSAFFCSNTHRASWSEECVRAGKQWSVQEGTGGPPGQVTSWAALLLTLVKCKCCLVVELRVACFSQHHTCFLYLHSNKQHFSVICATWFEVNIWFGFYDPLKDEEENERRGVLLNVLLKEWRWRRNKAMEEGVKEVKRHEIHSCTEWDGGGDGGGVGVGGRCHSSTQRHCEREKERQRVI